MILILDNYDSFTYNLVQYVGQIGINLEVIRNDQVSLMEIKSKKPGKIILSPGPGRPESAGIAIDIVKEFYNRIPILGVCLGHQIIAQAFAGQIIQAPEIIHGKTSQIYHNGSVIFFQVPKTFEAARYHSLVVDRDTFPSVLRITAKTDDELIMAFEHKIYPVFGVQFHPESIATKCGKKIINNFLTLSTDGKGELNK